MVSSFVLVVIVVVVALIFDFVNGFNDAANAIATIVVSKTLTPFQAVLLAGASNFIGYFLFGTAVARMIGKGVVHFDQVTLPLIFSALIGAVIWQIITWRLGLPSSSSHALIGGLIGSGIAAAGFSVVMWGGVGKIFLFIFLAPMIGISGSMIVTTITIWLFRKQQPSSTSGIFKNMQLIAAVCSSIGHGTNDAQKTMGIMALALFTGHVSNSFATGKIDGWVVFGAYTAISIGTICGGWRIVKTMGTRITKIREMEGFCANAAASLVLMGTAHAGIPVSTTHVIAGSIMGVGAIEHAKTVRWITARRILLAWVMTIPMAACTSAVTYFVVSWVIAALGGVHQAFLK
jgi:inorganic phosphate transporter, PiT family